MFLFIMRRSTLYRIIKKLMCFNVICRITRMLTKTHHRVRYIDQLDLDRLWEWCMYVKIDIIALYITLMLSISPVLHFLISRVTVWLQLFESCTDCQSLRGSSTSCACWFTSLFLGHTPEYISDLLTSVANIPGRSTMRASSCGNLIVPRTRRRIGDRAFSVAAPRAWNGLPTELKLLRSKNSFRRDLKTFLFHSVYGHRDTDWLCDAPSDF